MIRKTLNAATETKLNETLARVATLDLERIRIKLQNKLGWTDERAAAAEEQYRCYLTLMLLEPTLRLAPPSQDADEIWHGHILDTLAYQADCERLFGRFVHHVPSYGTPAEKLGMAAAREDTDRAFLRYFGDPTSQDVEAAGCVPCLGAHEVRQAEVAGCVPCFGEPAARLTNGVAVAST